MNGIPILIKTIIPVHSVAFDHGPRIGKTETYRLPNGDLMDINFWYEGNGKLYAIR